jgi:hypothetical protein
MDGRAAAGFALKGDMKTLPTPMLNGAQTWAGYCVTVNVAIGLVIPLALAVIITVPGASPVASPFASMLATPPKLLCQVNCAWLTELPLASVAEAVNCCVWPTLMVALSGVSLTVAIAGFTVSVAAVLVMPASEAVICVLPAATPVATPAEVMVAMPVLLLAQVKVWLLTV